MRKKISDSIKKKNPVYIRAGLLFIAASACFAVVFVWDNSRKMDTDETGRKILRREENGQRENTEELEVQVGEIREKIVVKVSERAYTEDELEEVFSAASEQLTERILGDNESLDEVRRDLDLITEIPEYGISVSWESDDYSVIDMQGKLNQEALTEDGKIVTLTAVLGYYEEKVSYEFCVRVFPPRSGSREQVLMELEEELEKSDQQNRTEEYMPLPDQIGGREAAWRFPTETRAFGILILGAGGAVLLCVSEKQRKKEARKKEILQMKMDYPQIINKLTLYIGAGMTIRRAWFCIAQDYEKNREKTGKRKAYEEMVCTMNQIRGGGSEGECYESCGARCGITSYRKFGMLLSQNLRKGPRGITETLRREAEEAFEERMNQAKKLGEEAGTKLMIPMFLMLAVVFLIVMVPALLSIQF